MRIAVLIVSLLMMQVGTAQAAPDLDKLAQAPDPASDIAQYKRFADQGDVSAQFKVGAAYGKARNFSEAARYFKLAADRGLPEAQSRLAALTCQGWGVAKDIPECIRLYRLAAASGDTDAQNNLAARFLFADGVQASYDEALRLARLTANKGSLTGLVILGAAYELGAGVPKNLAEATRYYKQAADQGHAGAQQSLNRLAGKASPNNATVSVTTLTIPLQRQGGVFTVSALLNEAVQANFVVDSGAGVVVVPESVVQALRNAGKLSDSDFTGVQRFKIANGAVVQSQTFTLRSLSVNGRFLPNIRAGVSPSGSLPLLGQSFLERFSAWSIDNERQALLLKEKDITHQSK